MPIHDWTRVIPGTFHDFHHEWISTIKRSLNAGVLPSNYYAMAEQIAGGLGPGVLTLESVDLQEEGEDYVDAGALSGGGTALATTAHLRAKLSEKSEAVLSA